MTTMTWIKIGSIAILILKYKRTLPACKRTDDEPTSDETLYKARCRPSCNYPVQPDKEFYDD